MILVWKLDRAFRSMPHMVSTVQDLRRWGVGLRSYSEPMIDTTDASPMGNLLLNILAAVAEFERGLIAERVRAGTAKARKQGKPVGRAPVLDGNLERPHPGDLGRHAVTPAGGPTARRVPFDRLEDAGAKG